MPFLFLFLDGVGLGPSDPHSNPFALASTPNLSRILGGQRLVKETLGPGNEPLVTAQATLLGLDAALGVEGRPQSASGQAAILTGINIPAALGRHYGPKPNPEIRAYLQKDTLFHTLVQGGFRTALLNAYPQSYFHSLRSGRRLPGAVAMSALEAGLCLKTKADLLNGRAISADFTAQGWREQLKITDAPLLSPRQAGKQLARLAKDHDFSFFEFWLSDYAGHKYDLPQAVKIVETLDTVLGGLITAWQPQDGLILITSDHGNLEDTRTRKHTLNLVPGLVIGPKSYRRSFTQSLVNLTGIAPAINRFFR